jgi:hypothetical protein
VTRTLWPALTQSPKARHITSRPVDAATSASIDLLDRGLTIFEVRVLEQSHQVAVIARMDLAVDPKWFQKHNFSR